ncbi:SH3-like domain-containing protein [Rhizobium sp. RU35A]|uniref:SH3 domain-containing protein n=1 Tax=Rhizobium straminoryzae TaxID=1387186 RepID=A0A549TE95_9HYPH|nr:MULTISPECIES: SH3 domain-containing protein [Rhizobium]TRL40473.1 SH3 domain-containing protein [Rhizobium straminoryzae]SIR07810.1 SH3-like domain-containing protein [Rhizobium sp. RU35A]
MRRFIRISCLAGAIALVGTSLAAFVDTAPAMAQTAKGASGLPLPRFVSLKSRRVNIRVGPSTDYAVSWMYLKEGLPMEIIQEYENWRRVRDADGTEGWVNQALLSGERTALAAPWMRDKGQQVFVNMRREAQTTAQVVAKLEPGVIMRLKQCTGDWCLAIAGSMEGWVPQSEIWGAYPGEAFK